MIENMHDRPYLRQSVGPEVTATMAAVLDAIRRAVDVPLGVQILAGANREALAVAFAGGASFIRAENFVFAHVADEGLMPDADAGSAVALSSGDRRGAHSHLRRREEETRRPCRYR